MAETPAPGPLRITAEELARAPEAPPPPSPPQRVSQLAVASLVLGLLGLPLVGLLLGPVAICCGLLALSAMRRHPALAGERLAVAGLVAGCLAFAAWTTGLVVVLSRPVAPPAPPDLRAASTRAPPDFAHAPPHIRRALRANVVVRCRGGRGEQGLGSGVVVARGAGAYYALTNRHVAECGAGAGGLTAANGGGADEAATVAWSAPEAIDAVLLKVATATPPEPATLQAASPPRVGDPVFAVGNPLGYEATFTAGVLSAMRAATYGPHRLRVLQVQASINPGNSGGGLYDATGHLVGLATWSTDKGLAEGLGFAVSTEDLLALLREGAPPELRADLGALDAGGTTR